MGPKDGLWPFPQLRRWRSCSPRILLDRWWSPHKGPVLKLASLSNSLYWARWIWVRSHLQWKAPPQIGTLQLALSVGKNCVLVRTVIGHGGIKTPRGNDDGQPTGPQMENCREVPNSTGVWCHVHGLRPHQGPDDPRTSWAAPVGLRWRNTAAAQNAFKGLRSGNSFWRSVLVPSNSLE